MTPVLHVTASQPQHTPAGRLLGKLYYSGFIEKTLARNESYGYPHNGGLHTLHLAMPRSDLDAFLSLVEEQYPNHEGTPDFVRLTREVADGVRRPLC